MTTSPAPSPKTLLSAESPDPIVLSEDEAAEAAAIAAAHVSDSVATMLRGLRITDTGELAWMSSKKRKACPTWSELYIEWIKGQPDNTNVSPQDFVEIGKELLKTKAATVDAKHSERDLSKYDLEILSNFRFFISTDHIINLIYVSDPALRTVILGQRANLRDTIISAKRYNAERLHYLEVFQKAVDDGQPMSVWGVERWEDDNKSEKFKALSFKDYLESIGEKIFEDDTLLIDEPKTMSNSSDEFSYSTFLSSKLPTPDASKCRDWTDWETSLPEHSVPVWRAWFYSLFVAENEGRQYPWLHGRGMNGKSKVVGAITDIFEDLVGVVTTSELSSQFALAHTYGKRICVWDDCRNVFAPHSDFFHRKSGGGTGCIEGKGLKAFTSKNVYSKMLVTSNFAPDVYVNEINELTRMMYFQMRDPPPSIMAKYCKCNPDGSICLDAEGHPVYTGYNLRKKLGEQMLDYVSICRPAYDELCPAGDFILIPPEMSLAVQSQCSGEQYITNIAFVSECLTFSGDLWCTCKELQDSYYSYIGRKAPNGELNHIYRTLTEEYHCERTFTKIDGHKTRIVRGCSLKLTKHSDKVINQPVNPSDSTGTVAFNINSK